MALSADLLEQAVHLAGRETAGPPKQASLRRAVSTAYYAVFHLLTEHASAACSPSTPAALRLRVQRAFDHGKMKDFCKRVSGRQAQPALVGLSSPAAVFPPALQRLATAFVKLQEARHLADYDTSVRLTRSYVNLLVQQAQQAFLDLRGTGRTDEANIFFAGLLFSDRWNR